LDEPLMIVPKFWAEARAKKRTARKQVTVRRFGWSDESEAAAWAMADARAKAALAEILEGGKVARRERRQPYNGSEGVPIREEIIATHGQMVLTRNSYGAVCLNTPNVFFADIDFNDDASCVLCGIVVTCLSLGGIYVGAAVHSWLVMLLAVAGAIILGVWMSYNLHKIIVQVRGGQERIAKSRVESFLRGHPDWNFRVYRTPAGLRVLATHATFDPNAPAVAECFRALGTDPIYVRMCSRQHCFRARVSPKPWRIGIGHHLRPRPGVWPVDPAQLPERQRWIEGYERAAKDFASCRFLESLGSGTVDSAVADVQQIHDELCRAGSELPIA
jgi:hypothetical protein